MTKKTTIFFILFFSAFLISTGSGAGKWELDKNESGIKVFTRNVAGSGLKEFRGEVILKNTRLSSVLALLQDITSYTKWIHNCINAKVVKEINSRERVTYLVTKTPWPTSNRDAVSHSRVTQDQKTLGITVTMTGRPKFIPETKDNVRVPSMKGFWKFIPVNSDSVKVIYQLHTDPGGSLPDWLSNAFVVDMPFNSLKKMRSIVKQPKYKNAKIKGIKEP